MSGLGTVIRPSLFPQLWYILCVLLTSRLATVVTSEMKAVSSPDIQLPVTAATSLDSAHNNGTANSRPPHHLVLLYGLLATTIINAAALVGFVFVPLHRFRCYPLLISFMVATAVGSLVSAAVIVLIPEAFELMSLPTCGSRGSSHWYLMRSVSICIGAFLFFILEFLLRLLKSTLEARSRDPLVLSRVSSKRRQASLVLPCDDHLQRLPDRGDTDVEFSSPVLNVNGHKSPTTDTDVTFTGTNKAADSINFCTANLCHRLATLDPLVWMIVLGDGLHNFMDGVSIAAGFTADFRLGLSVSLAVLCEELPHELGDIAVLLRSGLSPSMAIFFNFSSACTAYIGFFVGVYLGELENATMYIFAITGGFFLYIALADMLPDLRRSEDAQMDQGRNVFPLFLIHLSGLAFGFGCVVAITLAGAQISI